MMLTNSFYFFISVCAWQTLYPCFSVAENDMKGNSRKSVVCCWLDACTSPRLLLSIKTLTQSIITASQQMAGLSIIAQKVGAGGRKSI